jgi:hypothetical protein
MIIIQMKIMRLIKQLGIIIIQIKKMKVINH